MIDWFSGQIGCDARFLALDRVYMVSKTGKVRYGVEQWTPAAGSYSDTVQVKRCVPHNDLWTPDDPEVPPLVYKVTGNPVKFLQGHNCFGPSVVGMREVVLAMVSSFPEVMRPKTVGGGLHASRVDITTMVELGSHGRVHEWLLHAASRTRSRHGRPLVSGHTVYWGQHSRSWSIKAYCKLCELRAHPSALGRLFDLQVSDYLAGQVRIELTLRGPELKKLRSGLSEDLIWSYFDRLEVGVMKTNAELERLDSLKLNEQGIYLMWANGRSVREKLSHTSFYRYRRKILDVMGVDICSDPKDAADGFPREEFDKNYLRAHEVTSVPAEFSAYMFKPLAACDLSIGLS